MNRRRTRPVLLLAVMACGREGRPASEGPVASPAPPAPPADSLVLDAAGLSVWHTLSREATGSGGERCLERTLEIRRDGMPPVRVPLLYTRDVPRLIDDSTLEARVYRDCAPGDRYRIDARTGQPTPVR
jgi:hypothetical protein